MWNIETTEKFERRLKEYKKKRKNELVATLNNLDTYVTTLNQNVKPKLIKAGCIHIESKGVIAIDQKGGKGKLKQTRLYLFSDEEKSIVHLITLGDKNSQKNDIKDCETFIKNHRRSKDA